MNRFFGILSFVLFMSLSLSCSEEEEEMDPWETEMAKQLQADNVQLSHINTTRKVDGVSAAGENYLQLNILNSKMLGEIDHNKRLMSKKCDEIKDAILLYPALSTLPEFDELRLNVIETSGALFFKTQKTNTTTYKVR